MASNYTCRDAALFRRLLRDDRGVTLLEILVAMVILGLLATLGSTQLMGYLDRAKVDTAKLQLAEIATAVDLFQIDIGRVPTSDEGLSALMERPPSLSSWRGPYLRKRGALQDPWGRPYEYVGVEQNAYQISSFGSDGKAGGEGSAADLSHTPAS